MTAENQTIQEDTHKLDAEIGRVNESRFTRELELLIKESEETRLMRMKQYQTRGFISMNLGILSILIGISGFGWLFMMEAQVISAFGCLILSIIPAVLLNIWAAQPPKTYLKEHKSVFMPKLAKTLNGLSFHQDRGVSSKILGRLAVIPAHDKYEAEDCFMGVYKGVKVIFSEARLYSKVNKDGPVFDGIFVLMETPEDVIEGHTIITSNHKMVKAYQSTRWKDMSAVHISVSNPDWDKFQIFSTKPESAELMVGERLLKELAEAGEVFDNAQLTACLFGKKYIFMMIPYAKDMFEASNMFVPITTKSQALEVKKEVEQLLEVIDVFDLYQPPK